MKSHLLTHTDVKPKQLLEIAERMESPGHLSTCSDKFRGSRGEVDIEDEDIVEPEIDVCSDDADHHDIAEDVGADGNNIKIKEEETVDRPDLSKIRFCGFSIEQIMRK